MTADGSRTATSADRPTPRASQCAVSSKRSRKAYVATRRPRASHARSGAGPSSGRCPWGSAGSGSPASAASGSGPSRAGAPRFVASPATIAVMIATSGRTAVMRGSMRAQLIAIESTPVSGVAMRKATVAPLLAPCRTSPSAVGSTPQEQRGTGTPMIDAQSTDLTRPGPRKRRKTRDGTRTASRPATAKPNSRKSEASLKMDQVSQPTWRRKSITGLSPPAAGPGDRPARGRSPGRWSRTRHATGAGTSYRGRRRPSTPGPPRSRSRSRPAAR